MRLLPESAAEFGSNIPWIMEKRLEIIEEIALGSQTSGRDAPDMDEAWERMWEAVGRRDQEAEDEAFVDHTRAEVWEWWQGFSERPLLTDLYRRAARREAKSGSLDSRRRPSHSQGLRIARALFADISDKGRLDPEQESATVAQVLAAQLLPPMGVPSRPRCEITLGAPSPAWSTSTRSAASMKNWTTRERPSRGSSPRGSGTLPVGAGGVPP